ncbi:unnamed protein product, partial [Prorocentrum cordatum]
MPPPRNVVGAAVWVEPVHCGAAVSGSAVAGLPDHRLLPRPGDAAFLVSLRGGNMGAGAVPAAAGKRPEQQDTMFRLAFVSLSLDARRFFPTGQEAPGSPRLSDDARGRPVAGGAPRRQGGGDWRCGSGARTRGRTGSRARGGRRSLKRNVGACLASGWAIAHFDDGCLYAPRYLGEMLAELARVAGGEEAGQPAAVALARMRFDCGYFSAAGGAVAEGSHESIEPGHDRLRGLIRRMAICRNCGWQLGWRHEPEENAAPWQAYDRQYQESGPRCEESLKQLRGPVTWSSGGTCGSAESPASTCQTTGAGGHPGTRRRSTTAAAATSARSATSSGASARGRGTAGPPRCSTLATCATRTPGGASTGTAAARATTTSARSACAAGAGSGPPSEHASWRAGGAFRGSPVGAGPGAARP